MILKKIYKNLSRNELLVIVVIATNILVELLKSQSGRHSTLFRHASEKSLSKKWQRSGEKHTRSQNEIKMTFYRHRSER